jgi:hypothetical protein
VPAWQSQILAPIRHFSMVHCLLILSDLSPRRIMRNGALQITIYFRIRFWIPCIFSTRPHAILDFSFVYHPALVFLVCTRQDAKDCHVSMSVNVSCIWCI